ncbi:GNAT family N-acetyltransferase [Paraburkholderia phymatum]|uniref:GCN5-related N-acetyltransferase n=1 Tax=Paraburkholderia phymatum (strain DSM 17167 / CIP 108236 / LMG 21445 / STM815) TaxID=391038 RepID=B2JSP1_PARP8|nr:GNAT family N-acetyltransferase [Paraburkholderia phymatum]ACC75594.1 GCN5-related N-acetyltransferase [Paraburkholderia phymatum STM815]
MSAPQPVANPAPATFRPFTADDIDAAHALSLQVGWPHRADDWRFVAGVGSGFIAQSEGGVAGTALCWKYGTGGASLGMVIVSPDQQGRGIGRELMERLLEALDARTTVLHATPAGQPLYQKLGFNAIGTIHQHQAADFRVPQAALAHGEQLRALQAADTPRLIDLSSRASGLDRSALLPALLGIAQGVALERDGEVAGFALLRPFGRGHAIGPVVAGSAGANATRHAQALIAHCLAANAGAFTRIDTPGDSGLTQWLEELGLERVDTVVKMSRNGAPASDPSFTQFAIVNQALG